MEETKFFGVIARVNAVLFLILLIAGVGLMLFLSFRASSWTQTGAVQIAEDPEDKSSPKIELVLGSVNELEGHEEQYVVLRSKFDGGKFTSGGRGGEKRNVLFISSDKLEPRWLFANHKNIIHSISPLKKYDSESKNAEVIAIFYEFTDEDTNRSESLDTDDLSNIALTRPDGSGFSIVERDITSIIDRTLSDDGSNLAILLQKKKFVYLNNYDPKTFELKSSSRILEVGVEM